MLSEKHFSLGILRFLFEISSFSDRFPFHPSKVRRNDSMSILIPINFFLMTFNASILQEWCSTVWINIIRVRGDLIELRLSIESSTLASYLVLVSSTWCTSIRVFASHVLSHRLSPLGNGLTGCGRINDVGLMNVLLLETSDQFPMSQIFLHTKKKDSHTISSLVISFV